MLKRMSVLVRSRLRKMVEGEKVQDFDAKGSVLEAFHLMDRVVGACLVNGLDSTASCPKHLRKHLTQGYAEFDWLKRAFDRSSRLQLVLELGFEDKNVDFRLELYQKGKQEPIYTLEGSIGLENGEMHSTGSSHIAV